MRQSLQCRKVLSFELNFPSRLNINHRFQYLTIREYKSTKSLCAVFHTQDVPDCLWKVGGKESGKYGRSVLWILRLGFMFVCFPLFLACTSPSSLPHCPSEPTCAKSSPEFCFTCKDLRLLSKSESGALGTGKCSPVRQPGSHTRDRASLLGERAPREHGLASDAAGLSSCCSGSDNEAGTTTAGN